MIPQPNNPIRSADEIQWDDYFEDVTYDWDDWDGEPESSHHGVGEYGEEWQ